MMEVRAMRKDWGIIPTYKMVDTCAAEFEAEHLIIILPMLLKMKCASVIKEGCCVRRRPIRIGQGVALTIALYIRMGTGKSLDMKPSLLTITRKL